MPSISEYVFYWFCFCFSAYKTLSINKIFLVGNSGSVPWPSTSIIFYITYFRLVGMKEITFKDIRNKIIFLFKYLVTFCHSFKQGIMIHIEIKTFSKIFKRILHTISATKIFFHNSRFSYRFTFPRISIVLQGKIISRKHLLPKFGKCSMLIIANSLQGSQIIYMSQFMCNKSYKFCSRLNGC